MAVKVIGLTGQTGAGKTTLCRVLAQEGFTVIDCDQAARRVVEPGSPCLRELAACFGEEILEKDGSLNRRKLGGLAFAHREKLARLNAIIHPYILAELERRIKETGEGHTNGIVLDAPTLFESGADRLCSQVAAVIAPEQVRLARIMGRDSISEAAALARMGAQQPDGFYTDRAQHVLVNDGSPAQLEEKARLLARRLREN